MKTILPIILLFLVSGCSEQGGMFTQVHPTNYEAMEKNMRTINIEGCEYLVYSYSAGYGGYGFMSHKGNCKNPIHMDSIEYEKETIQRTR